ncbi:helicase associated domain-containing protein [Streptomyces althioticus]|uniref:helicase associated domain-containing protein n=1 Tax=Streptomyces althioticus TaxID=83380 RepID=UPI0036F83A70
MLLTDPQWQRRVAADTQGHLPHALADVPALLDELARRLERPRLAGLLAPSVNGPLNAWVRACARQGASTKPAQLWRVAPAHRPAPLDKVLRAHRRDTASAPPVLPSAAQHSFGQGLAHARAYATEHGHLCATTKERKNGFDLGQWLARQRAAGPDLAPGHAAALAALDEWWNPPWPLAWQSRYYEARAQTCPGTVLAPELGFPGAPRVLRRWLYAQCEAWASLHPRQQQLLAGIGVTAEQAALAISQRTAPANTPAAGHERPSPAETLLPGVLGLARAYTAEHGHLCPAPGDHRDGFPLGAWLTGLRRQARRGTVPQAPLLTAIDPWWNPPWPLTWQRRYGSVRTHTRSEGPLDPTTGSTDL